MCHTTDSAPVDSDGVREATAYYDRLLNDSYQDSTRAILAEAIDARDLLYKARHQGHQARVLRPMLVDRLTYDRVCQAAARLARAIEIAAARLVADAALRKQLGCPEYLEPLCEWERPDRAGALIARLDGIATAAGGFAVLEYNAMPLGVHVGFELSRAFASMPIAQAFREQYEFSWPKVMDHVIDTLRTRARHDRHEGMPTIWVPTSKRDWAPEGDAKWLAYAAASGCRVVTASPAESELKDERLCVNRVPIDVLTAVPWAELLQDIGRTRALKQAIKSGAIRAMTGFATGLFSGYKATLELLSNPVYRFVFPPDLLDAVVAHVPWTRLVKDCETTFEDRRIDLLDFISRNRERLVLKPSGGAEGVGVMLGWTTAAEEWDRAIRRHCGRYIVQERVVPACRMFPIDDGEAVAWRRMATDTAPFVWGGTYSAGWLVRSTATDHFNISRGALHTPLWILESLTAR